VWRRNGFASIGNRWVRHSARAFLTSRRIFANYWLRVSDVAGLASATDQAKTQELPGRGDDFESEPGILSFSGRTELRRDLRRHNSAPNARITPVSRIIEARYVVLQ
jgi:hypothetical protein